MKELIDSLERCVKQATFISEQKGKIGWSDYRSLVCQRRWNDSSWMLWSASKLEIDDALVDDLAAKLEPVLSDFTDAGTGRFGNGLFLLLGGPGTWAYPTAFEFARTLIEAAVKSSASQVVASLQGWASGEPLRFQVSALLEGADTDEELQLTEGIRVTKLPKSSADLPGSLPPLEMTVPLTEVIGGVIMSIDCEMSPAFYRPAKDEIGQLSSRKGEYKMVSGRVPELSLENFCESVSVAANGHIDWFLQWTEYGPLGAFTGMPSGVTHKARSVTHMTKKISQADLNEALEIHRTRYGGGESRENLELAIRRWIRSKRPGSDLDKLIELRIALEALYGIGGANEKAFRIATYGAWHLGKDFKQRHLFRETLRKAYSDSSNAVHGGKLKYAVKDPDLVSSAQDICRKGILKRLKETERPKWDEIILGARE